MWTRLKTIPAIIMQTCRPSFCETLNRVIHDRTAAFSRQLCAVVSGYGSTIPNVQYAASETGNTDPADVSFGWLGTLEAGYLAGVIYTSACTLLICGTFSYRFVLLAMDTLLAEIALLLRSAIMSRFVTEMLFGLLAAISGAAIASDPYQETPWAYWAAFVTGLIALFSPSFLGMHDAIVQRDPDHLLRRDIIAWLERMEPQSEAELNLWLQDKHLTSETAMEILSECFSRAIFRTETPEIKHYAQRLRLIDNTLSVLLTSTGGIIYLQTGFDGLNIITGHRLTDMPDSVKILLGICVGMPLLLFDYFIVRILQGDLAQLWPDIKTPREYLKLTALIATNAGNAIWYYGLAKSIIAQGSLFNFYIGTDAGQIIFPLAAYLVCFWMGVNGLAPWLFLQINTTTPTKNDIVKSLKFDVISANTMSGLREHTFFKRQRGEVLEEKPRVVEMARLV